jgi:anti-sigma regulatory factor (Ser/Thr protein kinase)
MLDISLHLLDLLQNCAHAGATKVDVIVLEDAEADLLEITVRDNGRGMEEGTVKKALDPFYSSSDKRVGLGLPFVAQAAAMAGGTVRVDSKPGVGTSVIATFKLSHVDRQPIGDLAATAVSFLAGNGSVELSVTYQGRAGHRFSFDTSVEFPPSKREDLGQIGFLCAVEEKLRDGLAKAGFSPDGGGISVEVH